MSDRGGDHDGRLVGVDPADMTVSSKPGRRIRVAIVAAHDIVDTGLRGILANVAGIELVDRHPPFGEVVDVVLYDSGAMALDADAHFLREVKNDPPVIMVARDLRPDLTSRAMVHGAVGSVSIEADAAEVLAAIREVAATGSMESSHLELGWEAALTLREVAVLSGVTSGYSNEDISELLFISPNTLKTYVRRAYAKIGVTTRSEAMAWCLQHGFDPPSVSR
jgi:DNA-binding NarL/FixJ family response regulator